MAQETFATFGTRLCNCSNHNTLIGFNGSDTLLLQTCRKVNIRIELSCFLRLEENKALMLKTN